MQTFDIYFGREDGVARFRARVVLPSREAALAYDAPEGFRVVRVRKAPHRFGLRGYR